MDEGASFWEVSFIFGVVMKKFFLILLSSLLVLSSCSTTERAYSFSSSDGIRVFLRPVKLKGELPVVLDLTIPTEKSKITGDATLNYSLYTKKGTIRIYGKDGFLSIEDTGIGITAEDLPRIFEKGYTGYNGRLDKKSTGIGLYLCQKVLKKLGHGITITSVPGKGTKAVLRFVQEKREYD